MGLLLKKTALVTGAARGIGLAIAAALISEGAQVYLSDIDEAGVFAASARLGDQAYGLKLDVTCEADWHHASTTLGALDIVVNNAGITGFSEASGPHDPEHLDMASWRQVHAVNLDGVALGCRFAIAAMRAGGGSIINIASRSGQVGVAGAAAYASSKAGVINHTRSVALHCTLQGYDVRCNAIAPAAIMTEMWDQMLGLGQAREDAMAQVEAGIPMGRFGTVEEVAAMAVFLASAQSSYMTGTIIDLDGGIRAGGGAPPARATSR